jgi:glycosyltransferase involved in cell wall biosynthesis
MMQLSVLIRNLNEAKSLKETLLALQKQHTSFEYEVVVIDNESDDDSVEVASKMGATAFVLKRSEFTYGHALNYGLSRCKGEIIVILSAHVALLNEFFLEKIPSYFNDPTVAGLRFVLATSPQTVAHSIANGPQKLVYEQSADFASRNWNNFIVNHCSAIKRACWEMQPFDEEIFASEDKLWGINILKKNYTLLYNVPCFYVYTRAVDRRHKIQKQVIDITAKEMISGAKDRLFSISYLKSFFTKMSLEFKHVRVQLLLHNKVYKAIKKYKKDLK